MSDPLDPLRARIGKLRGAARTRPLIELGQKLADAYWRHGPGQPAGMPYLNEAIAAMGEAIGYFAADDAWRGQVAGQLGWLHGVRFLAHAGPETDRDAGVALLEEALGFPKLPPVLVDMCRLALGQLYLSRAIRVLQTPDLAGMLIGPGLPPETAGDAERAADLFRTILAGPTVGAEAVEVVKAMLTVAEAFKDVMISVRGGAAGFDMAGMMRAVQALQDMHRLQKSRASAGAAFPAMPSIFDAEEIARMDPMDRPVTVVDAPLPPRQDPPPSLPRLDPIVLGPADARRELHTLVAPDGDLLAALAAALGPDGKDLPADAIDDAVALAVAATTDPAADGIDDLIRAVVIYLRGRMDPGGYAREPGGDFDLAAQALRRAERTVRQSHPGAAPVANRLAALLARTRPSQEAVASGFGSPGAVFVADPRGERPAAAADALLLREAFYPVSQFMGTGAAHATPARPQAVLAALRTPMLHLACTVTPAGALRLADGTELGPDRIRAAETAGGLAVLPPTGVGLTALADALLTAGFRGVVTWKRVIPSRIAALMLFVLHGALVDDHLEPRAAVAHTRDWTRDPHRRKPPRLPAEYAATYARRDLIDETYWGALHFLVRQ